MERRDLLSLFAGAGAAGAVSQLRLNLKAETQSGTSADSTETLQERGGLPRRKPNILVLMADQHSPHVLGCYGDPIVRTPNLDGLARRGVLFENAYCAAPLCVPSRMSFLTGRTPSENRVWRNADILYSGTATLAHALGAAGYQTPLIGRMHFEGPDQFHGFQKRLVGDIQSAYAENRDPLSPNLFRGATQNSSAAITIAGPGHTAYETFDGDVTNAAVSFLRGHAGSNNPPFCAVVGFALPHSPLVCSKQDWDYYHDRVTVPQMSKDYFDHLHAAVKTWRQQRGVDNLTEEEIRRARAGYYGLVTEVDRNIGRILNVLSESGLDQSTLVVYLSDHGEMAGENGMWWKFNFYEGSVKVPLIFSFPGQLPSDRRVREVVSLMDVAPALCHVAGAGPLPNASGRNLQPLLSGNPVAWANEALSELPALRGVPAARMIRRNEWKLVHFDDGSRPQLFNLENDPHEFHDLGEDPAYKGVREDLLDRVMLNWSPTDMERELQKRDRDEALIAKWAGKANPPDPTLWRAPAGVNVFPE